MRRVATQDPRDIVRRGYDALSVRYEQCGGETKYGPWLSELRERIPAGGAVLDLGCGSGVPVARDLAAWWSQADAATYRSWITQAGLSIEREEFAPEGDSGHALFWASRPARPVS